MKKIFVIDFLGFIAVKAFSMALCCIPLRLALWMGRRGGDFAYFVNVKRRSIAYANLKAAFPEKEIREIKRIARAHFENLGMSMIEFLKLPVMGRRYVDRHLSFKDTGSVKKALEEGKGAILLTAHFGNWELGSFCITASGYTISVFVREQKYARLNGLLNKYREMKGSKVITKGFSVRNIVKTLNNNGMVAMVGDQDAGANGIFVDFFNRPASMAEGPLIFGLKTGAAILPTFIRRVGYDKHILEIGEALEIDTGEKERDIKVGSEKITDILEGMIRKFPEQWLWSHKRWKSTPERTILVLSDGKPGHFNQGAAVGEMFKGALYSNLKARKIKERPIVKIHTVEVKFRSKLARLALDVSSLFAGKRCQGCLGYLKLFLKKECFDEIKNRYADIIISCGASLASVNIFLKYENNAKNIVIMKPGLGRSRKVDLVILPRHDAPGKIPDNVLITEAAPNRIGEESAKEAMSHVAPGVSPETNRGLGILIGGDTKSFKLRKETVRKVIDGALRIAQERELELFISTSRRTSDEISSFLKDKLSNIPRCRLLVIANEKNIEHAVPAIFGMSAIVIVSPDSISMISEAASSGKYVVVFKEHQDRGQLECQGKYEENIKNLESRGYIKTAEAEEIYDCIKGILKEKPAVKKLEDREKIMERLKGIV